MLNNYYILCKKQFQKRIKEELNSLYNKKNFFNSELKILAKNPENEKESIPLNKSFHKKQKKLLKFFDQHGEVTKKYKNGILISCSLKYGNLYRIMINYQNHLIIYYKKHKHVYAFYDQEVIISNLNLKFDKTNRLISQINGEDCYVEIKSDKKGLIYEYCYIKNNKLIYQLHHFFQEDKYELIKV